MSSLLALAGLLAGIEVGARLGGGAAAPVLAAGCVALVGAWLVEGRARLAIATAALALLGCATMQRALDGLEHHDLEPGSVVMLTGTLVSDPEVQRFRSDALVRVGSAGRTVLVRAANPGAQRLAVLDAGDRIVFEGRVEALPAGDHNRWKHAVALVDDVDVRAFAGPTGVLAAANEARAVITRGTRPLPPGARALLLGFLLGDTRGIPDDVAEAYRASGLSHLLAVSGANVAFVLALAAPLLRRLRLAMRSAGAIAIVVLFAAMTRFEPSVLRASVLATVAVLAVLAGRPQSPMRALVLAVVALLLVDPFLTRSVGFQLSCAASAGIVAFSRPLGRRLRGPELVREPLAVSLAAQLGVTPVLLATFGSVPVAAPIANLLAAPAAEALGVYGMVASLAGGLVPPLAAVLQAPNELLLAWITGIARATAAAGGAVDLRGLVVMGLLATVGRRAVHHVASGRRGDRHPDAHDRDGHPQPHP